MSEENWNKAVDFYATEKHKKLSDQNKVNKAKQVITNRGGTSSYSSYCHKHVSYDKNFYIYMQVFFKCNLIFELLCYIE